MRELICVELHRRHLSRLSEMYSYLTLSATLGGRHYFIIISPIL